MDSVFHLLFNVIIRWTPYLTHFMSSQCYGYEQPMCFYVNFFSLPNRRELWLFGRNCPHRHPFRPLLRPRRPRKKAIKSGRHGQTHRVTLCAWLSSWCEDEWSNANNYCVAVSKSKLDECKLIPHIWCWVSRIPHSRDRNIPANEI